MNFLDLIALVFDNLGRRKARVALTAIGVVIGTAAVVVLVSLAIGLQRNANEQLYGIGDLTQIQVFPNYGEGGPIIADKSGGGSQPPTQQLITTASLAEFKAIQGVVAVIPRDYSYGQVMMYYNRLEAYAGPMGVGVDDLSLLGLNLAGGSLQLEKGTAVIGAQISLQFYNPHMRPGQEPSPPPDLLNQQVKLTLVKWDEQGSEIRKSYQVRIVGVLQETRDYSDYTMFMRLDEVTVYNEWFQGRRINRNKDGYNEVIVKVDRVDRVLDVAEQINDLGYQAYTPQSFVQGINNFYVILQVIFGGVGAIALLVAAIGIANTMAMAILERTREIGLMKAIGATNRDVLSAFLGEAGGIGFIGGLGGVILGWSAGQVLNVLAKSYLAGQAASQGGPPPSMVVFTPLWLPVFALGFATLIGLLSGLYPALRAATMVPVTALKYE